MRSVSKYACILLYGYLYTYVFSQEEAKTPVKVHSNNTLIIKDSLSTDSIKGTYVSIPINTQENKYSTSLANSLGNQSSIKVNKLGAGGSYSSLSLRGTNPTQTNIYLNGMLLNDSISGYFNLENLPLEVFEKAELFPTYTPSHLLGTNIGGTLNLIIKKNKSTQNPSWFLHTSANSLLTGNVGVGSFSKYGMHYVRFDGGLSKYTYTSNNGTLYNKNDDFVATTKNNDYKGGGYTGSYYWENKQHEFNLVIHYYGKERGLPGVIRSLLDAVRYEEHLVFLNFSHKYYLYNNLSLAYYVSIQEGYTSLTDPKNEFKYNERKQKRLISNIENGYSIVWGFLPNLLTLHFSIAYNFIDAKGIFQKDLIQIVQRHTFDTGATLEYIPIEHGIRLATTIKGNLFLDRPQDDLKSIYAITPFPNALIHETLVTGSVYVGLHPISIANKLKNNITSYKSASLLELYSSASLTARNPRVFEKYGDGSFILPNATLEKEKGIGATVGIKSAITYNLFSTVFLVEYFYQNIDNLISLIHLTDKILRSENIGKGLIHGAETSIRFAYSEYFTTVLGFTFIDAIDKGMLSYYYDKYIPYRPRFKTNYYIESGISYIKIFSNISWQSYFWRDRYNSKDYLIPSSLTIDIGLSLSYNYNNILYNVIFSVNNITNNQTADVIGYPLPGRFYEGRIKINFF